MMLVANHNPPEISVVIPCRNEEGNIEAMAAAVIAEIEPFNIPFDVIFIDNESQDRTVELAKQLCASDPRIRLIVNTRNFGQMRSPTHAIFEARGQAIISLCCDFQDPPTLIRQFIERWRAGVDIVLGVREAEKSSFLLGLVRDLSYEFARRFGDYPIIRNATGFGLYDQKVVRAIARLNEPEPFFRGMLVETGYSVETILYPRPRRARGKSNNNFFVLLDFTMSALAGFSKKLVRVPFALGFLALGATFFTLIAAVIALFIGGTPSFWLICSAVEFQFGALFIALAIMGDQIRLISERTRQTPLVIERERINFPEGY